jgi:hypothetical protein
VRVEPVLYELEDLWRMADLDGQDSGDGAGGQAGGVVAPRMTFEEMDAAKARRQW